jgi:hypothetical protein
LGKPLVAARPGLSPLAHGLFTVLDREADAYRVGVAGGKDPLRWVAQDAERLQPGRNAVPPCGVIGVSPLATGCYGVFPFAE